MAGILHEPPSKSYGEDRTTTSKLKLEKHYC